MVQLEPFAPRSTVTRTLRRCLSDVGPLTKAESLGHWPENGG
jgi:hypothetical protein